MEILYLCAIFCFLSTHVLAQSQFNNEEEKLKEKLFKNYVKDVIPVKKVNGNITAEFGTAMISLIDLNDFEQTLTINAWLRLSWMDFRLKWDPKDYKNTTVIRVDPSRVWKPDIVLYNSVAMGNNLFDNEKGPFVLIWNTGKMLYIPAVVLKSACYIDMSSYPNDKQSCKLKFGSWTFHGKILDLKPYEGKLDMDLNDYSEHNMWTITKNEGRRNIKYYQCCPEPYPDITYTLTFERSASYGSKTVISTGILISFLIPLIFCVSSHNGERTTLVVAILLMYTIMFIWVYNILKLSYGVPNILKYYTALMILTIKALVITRLLDCWYQARRKTSPPGPLVTLAKFIPTLCCCYPDDYKRQELEEAKSEEDNEAVTRKNEHAEWNMVISLLYRICFIIFVVLIILMKAMLA